MFVSAVNLIELFVEYSEIHGVRKNLCNYYYLFQLSELKRVNRLQKESEFHALNNIKIPVKANSVLTEILEEEAAANERNTENGTARSDNVDMPCTRRQPLTSFSTNDTEESDTDSCVGYVSIHQILREKSSRKEARRFLQNMQQDLNKIKEKVVTNKASLSEAAAALTDPRFVPLTEPASGADYGLSWWRLFLCALFFLLLLPIAYFIYLFQFADDEGRGKE